MPEMLYTLCESTIDFPPVEHALTNPNGLLAIGGDLTPNRILNAYKQGIFPWYSPDDPLMWWSPDPRAIIYTDKININRTLRKFLAKCPYTLSVNQDFNQVLENCADPRYRQDGTWITSEMKAAYRQLNKLGFAHSIEVWQNRELVGGLYGIGIGGFFGGESMFHRQTNASKCALVALTKMLLSQGVTFVDCQLLNPFLADMGAIEVSRQRFIQLKNAMLNYEVSCNLWQARQLNDII